MARPRGGSNLSLSQLETLVAERRNKIGELLKKERTLLRQLQVVQRQLMELQGKKIAGGPHPRNNTSLPALIEEVLAAAGKPVAVGEIMSAVQQRGYVSTSINFRALVNQMLVKDKRFVAAERGMYTLRSM